jgi:radical SAM superfamily enzyme YgiQ (UPF0313 family)
MRMELPCRAKDDILLPAGELIDIRRRLRTVAPKHDLTTVIVCAFDHRTRMLPFIIADTHMVPASVREVGSALLDAGFQKTRIVLQQWSRNVLPSRMKLDGCLPDVLVISSMSMHTAPCKALIRDACRIDPSHRPLIIVGGSVCIYEPWQLFSDNPAEPLAPDVAVTGEVYVQLQLMEVLLAERLDKEPLRKTFLRSRDAGLLDHIPGLIYAKGRTEGLAEELIDTGIQRLVGNFDENADPVPGYSILEPPSRRTTLASKPLPPERVRRYSLLNTLVLTQGCKFRCPYCPIPAYNQWQYRTKSGEKIADEMTRLYKAYGLRMFFGADDNFFNDKDRTLKICEALAAAEIDGAPLRKRVRLSTEVTVHDTLRMTEHLGLVRKAGLRALWLGVEDMTGTLVSKGQTVDKTLLAFELMRQRGIVPMPMMMHHDLQPLISRGDHSGLLNQVRMLQKAGAGGMQVLMISPAPGSKIFEETFTSGMMYDSVGGRKVELYMIDGNYVVASNAREPWKTQVNIWAAYLLFYNPLRLLGILILNPRNKQLFIYVFTQIWGMWGLTNTIRRTFGWTVRLMLCKIRRRYNPPASPIPMRSPDGGSADHDINH